MFFFNSNNRLFTGSSIDSYEYASEFRLNSPKIMLIGRKSSMEKFTQHIIHSCFWDLK